MEEKEAVFTPGTIVFSSLWNLIGTVASTEPCTYQDNCEQLVILLNEFDGVYHLGDFEAFDADTLIFELFFCE